MSDREKLYSLVPPPTRGWPQPDITLDEWLIGSPAHAGMAPSCPASDVFIPRFPRPRGDGPIIDFSAQVLEPVPPPTRGWPLSQIASLTDELGSPAHAGMAPQK